MSSALAVASVTAVLKDLLDNRLSQESALGGLGDVTVSALPPDRLPTGDQERSRLNLFLYRLTPHARWSGTLPALEKGERGRRPVLALDLHYLLTAYGEQDFQAEVLLGHAIQLLLETPVLTPAKIQAALVSGSPTSGRLLPPTQAALSSSTLADQLEPIEVCPDFLNTEETSRLWSALQARYRPSVAYKVSAVLIEASG